MTDQLITFETSTLAKEKGFTLGSVGSHVYNYYEKDGRHGNISWGHLNLDHPAMCPQTLLQRWLREQFQIFVSVTREAIGSDEWEWSYEIEYLPKEHWGAKRRVGFFKEIKVFSDGYGTYSGAWNKYEEALEKGLQAGLKLIQ